MTKAENKKIIRDALMGQCIRKKLWEHKCGVQIWVKFCISEKPDAEILYYLKSNGVSVNDERCNNIFNIINRYLNEIYSIAEKKFTPSRPLVPVDPGRQD